jgi:peroxiredoxin Q/BCP
MRKILFMSFLSFVGLTHAAELKVGDSAPSMVVKDEAGKELNLGEIFTTGLTLVYFYPKADTPGCTAQGCSLRDSYTALTDKGIRVIGVSHDNAVAQKAFKEKYKLPFTLIPDTENVVIKAFGVPSIMGFAKRQAYLIKDGKVVWTDLSASTAQQASDVLKAVGELR